MNDDTISRQAAIDEIVAWTVEDRPDIEMPTDLVGRINALPSAQPEIIRCKECKFWADIKRTKRHWCKTDNGLYDLNTSADDFCSRAERREE